MAENNENNLPQIAGDTLRSTTDANKAAAKQSRALSKQLAFMNIGAGMLTNASISLDKYAKSEQKKKSPVKSLKDMFSLTNVKQKSLQEQQADQIASKLGLTREELKLLQTRKELDESQKKVADEFRENAKKYGVNLDGIKTSFTDMGELLLKNGEDGTASLQEVLGETNANVIKELQAGNVAGRLQKIEADREKAVADARTTGIFEGILQNTEDMEEALIAGFKGMLDKMAEKSGKGIGIGLGLLAAPIMLSIGAIMGLKDSLVGIAKTAKAFGKLTIVKPLQGIVNFFKGIGNKFAPKQMEKGAKAISKFTTASAKFFGGVSASLTNASKAFKAGMDGLKVFRTATGQFGKLGFFGKVGAVVGKVIKPFKDILTGIGSAFARVQKLFAPVIASVVNIGARVKTAFNGVGALGTFFTSVKGAFAPIVKMAGTIGRVIGRAFYPITILMSVFDGIKGFIEGFEANGIIGGISGAFFGIVDSLVMKVLDLIKSLFSWIFEKLGFTGISEALDSFSFSEIWQGLGDKVQDFISYVKNFFGNLISSGISGIKKLFGFGGDDEEEEAPSNKESSRAADIRRRKMERGRMSQEEKDARNRQILQDSKAKAAREEKDTRNRQILKDAKANAAAENSEGAEVNARSQSAATSTNVISVVAPQTANVTNNSQSMSQTVAVPVSPTPSVASRRSGGRSGRINS